MNQKTIDHFYENTPFSFLDIHFKNFVEKLAKSDVREISLAAALVSHYRDQGHICVQLSTDMGAPVTPSELEDWIRTLRNSSVVGKPGEYKPLILDDQSRLYLYRYWEYQDRLASLIRKRVAQVPEDIDFELLEHGLARLFPDHHTGKTDWQRTAAFTALTRKFCVISGGPGTGKTTTVAKILALLLEQNITQRISLAAPTGKAAARLQESISHEKEKHGYEDHVRAAIPGEAFTLHRLLGAIPNSPYFRHHSGNRLSADAVVVDEASMVDMALMSKLVQALGSRTRLILLGDKDQLASVEAGSALGDICDSGCDGIVHLRESYRFGADSGIRAVSHAVNSGDADQALAYLKDEKYPDVSWKQLPRHNELAQGIRDAVIQGFEACFTVKKDPLDVFQRFERFRILCALRRGPYGVVAVNQAVERILRERNLIRPDQTWYEGRPILITSNDYQLRLFNGDMGIILRDTEAGQQLKAFFPNPDGSLRKLHPLRLPEHETVYAMTVHKSQGSEFDKVLLLLPDRDSAVLTRELIYTGITRAAAQIEIWGTARIFREAVSRRIERTSGLRDALA